MEQNLETRKDLLEQIRTLQFGVYNNHKNDSFGAQMLQDIASVDSQLESIEGEAYNIDLAIDGKPLAHLQKQMEYLKIEAEDLNAALDNPYKGTQTRAEILNSLISNNESQIENLRG